MLRHRPTSWPWLIVVAALFALAWLVGCAGGTARTSIKPASSGVEHREVGPSRHTVIKVTPPGVKR